MTSKLKDAAVAVSVVVMALAVVYGQVFSTRNDGPTASIDAVALGREFGPTLAWSLADGFDAGAIVLEGDGGSVASGIERQKQVAEAAKDKAFESKVGPAFSLLVPNGVEPNDQASKSALARAWRDFATGLRKVK